GMQVFRPSFPPASWTRTRIVRSFSALGAPASALWVRNAGAHWLKARRPRARPLEAKNSRRVYGVVVFIVRVWFEREFEKSSTKVIGGRLQDGDGGVPDPVEAAAGSVGEVLGQRAAVVGAGR